MNERHADVLMALFRREAQSERRLERPAGHEALPEVAVHPLQDALGFWMLWRQLPDLAAQPAGERRRRIGQSALADP